LPAKKTRNTNTDS